MKHFLKGNDKSLQYGNRKSALLERKIKPLWASEMVYGMVLIPIMI